MSRLYPTPVRGVAATANDRLKDGFAAHVAGSITLAAAVHFVAISYGSFSAIPDFRVAHTEAMEQVEVREYQLPPPPAAFQRPAIPVLSTRMDIDPAITISSTLLTDNPVTELPPPPTARAVDLSEAPVFTPYEVKPELKNRAEFQRLLERRYPAMFKDAGIGGKVVLWIYIDESGTVRNSRVVESTGSEELDQVARGLMLEVAQFSPAYNRDQRVPVWIQIPVTFQAR
jgi:TonB family protein